MSKLRKSSSDKADGGEKTADGQKEKTFLQKLLFLFLRLIVTLAGLLALAAAAGFHQLVEKYPKAELFSIVFAELGAVLLTIGILHFAYELFLRKQYKDEMLGAFQDAVRDELRNPANLAEIVKATREDNELYCTFLDHGVEAILHFSSDELSRQLRSAKSIRILKTWFPEDNQLRRAFEEALKNRDTKIELLLCHPRYELLRVRSQSTSVKADEARRGVIDALESIRRVRCRQPDPEGSFDQRNNNCNTRVGLYKGWPGCPVIWCDDRIFLGYYFFGQSSLLSPWIRVTPESQLATVLDQQFALIWKDERTQEFESCEALGHWLAPLTKARKERRGWWQKRKPKKLRDEMPASGPPPEGSPDPSS